MEIEIVSVGSPGLFGLGGRKAKVRAALKEEGEADILHQAQEVLGAILEKMGESARITAFQEDEKVTLRIDADDAGLLIGKQGQTLEALQYLVTKIVAKRSRKKVRIVIDIESYRSRHHESLTQLALKYGEKDS